MKTTVVLTTINSRESTCIPMLESKCKEQGWDLVVVGDLKTPDMKLTHGVYLSAEDQKKLPFKLSTQMPWNCYERKNIGYLYAYINGADYILNTDDDNYPIQGWEDMPSFMTKRHGPKLFGKHNLCNPLEYFNQTTHKIWPRGLPLHAQPFNEVINNLRYQYIGVVAGLWDGCPDFDALGHVFFDHIDWDFKKDLFIVKDQRFFTPYNTQNTLIERELIPFQMLAIGINRASDIWTSYISQYIMKKLNKGLMFISPTVKQKRNQHDPIKDFHDEIEVFLDTEELLQKLELVPSRNISALDYYYNLCDSVKSLFPKRFMKDVDTWLEDLHK